MKNKKVLFSSLMLIFLSIMMIGVPVNAATSKKVDVSDDIKRLHYRLDVTVDQYYKQNVIKDNEFRLKMMNIEKECTKLLETKKIPRKQKKCLKEIELNSHTMQFDYRDKNGNKDYSIARGHKALIDERLEKYGLQKYIFED